VKALSDNIRAINAPEGVSLPFEVASIPERAAAFFIDFFLLMLATLTFAVAGFLAGGSGFGPYAVSFGMIVSFLCRNFYFAFFELRWGGTTPGKRRLGLRVVSRDGGALSAEAVIARNLTREIETFLPLVALMAPNELLPGLPEWAAFIATVWIAVFGLLPLLGKDRLRIGDIVAGTLVVKMPKATLMEDLVEDPYGVGRDFKTLLVSATEFVFTREQLDLYGIKELQVLEDLLRRGQGYKEQEVLDAVGKKIKAKIGWPKERWDVDTWDFLSAFYKAQRGRLEQKMLFGVRQEEKKK
jgi:uncharacterized RDD family membrane protein YckC